MNKLIVSLCSLGKNARFACLNHGGPVRRAAWKVNEPRAPRAMIDVRSLEVDPTHRSVLPIMVGDDDKGQTIMEQTYRTVVCVQF